MQIGNGFIHLSVMLAVLGLSVSSMSFCVMSEQKTEHKVAATSVVLPGLSEVESKRLAACTPKNTVIAFDLHGVLFSLEKGKAVWTGIISIPWAVPRVLSGVDLKTAFREAANCQQPKKDVWTAVELLKRAGYPIVVFSNITEIAYADLKKQFPQLSVFDGVCTSKNKVQKPHPAAYSNFKNFLAERDQGDKEIIFFDDSLPNVQEAHKQNFLAFYYTPATLQQVTEQLIAESTIAAV